jgi:hypothetical protein
MKKFILLFCFCGATYADTVTTVTEVVREETRTVTTIRENGDAKTAEQPVLVVYRCDGRNCYKP